MINSLRLHPRLGAAIGLFALIGVLVYFSAEGNDLRNSTSEAIDMGYRYAYYVFEGDNDRIGDVMLVRHDPIPSLREFMVSTGERERSQLPSVIREPLSSNFDKPEDRLQLMAVDRRSNFYVLTFSVLLNSYLSEVIRRGEEPMIITIAIRYLHDKPQTWFQLLGRKIANLWLLPKAIQRLGSGGHWYLSGYRDTYNFREFVDWGQKNAERLNADAEAERKRFEEDEKSGAFEQRITQSLESIPAQVQVGLKKDYNWSESVMDYQLHKMKATFAAEKDGS